MDNKLQGLEALGGRLRTVRQSASEARDGRHDAFAILAVGIRIIGGAIIGYVHEMPIARIPMVGPVVVGPTRNRRKGYRGMIKSWDVKREQGLDLGKRCGIEPPLGEFRHNGMTLLSPSPSLRDEPYDQQQREPQSFHRFPHNLSALLP